MRLKKVNQRNERLRLEPLEARLFLSAYTFDDEFNGAIGSGPSAAWSRFNSTDPNNSSVVYTNTTPAQATASNPTTLQIVSDPLANDGKALAMSLTPNPNGNGTYDSAEICTEFDPSGAGNSLEYGHIEARIRLPGGSNSGAIWPAFWLLGDDISTVSWPSCGEIDIMENRGSQPGAVDSTLHGLASGGGDYNGGAGVGASYTLPNGAGFYSSYHVFAVDWGPNSVTFSVDGVPFYSFTPANLPSGATWEFNGHPFYIILDVCEGGNFAPGTITTEQTMDVDYVHASAYSTAASPPLADQDIGSPSPAGSADFDGLTTTLNGGGSDIYNKSDQFNFDSQSFTGNVTLIAQVDWVDETAQYAKGGLMIRDGTAANASYAFIQLNPAGGGVSGVGGASLEFRNGAGTSAYTVAIDPSADLADGPIWLKLTRSGNSFSGYDSYNGTTWNQLGAAQTISMNPTVQVGLADDSYHNGTLSTDTFSDVTILPGTLSDTNYGTPDRIGSAGFNNSTSSLTISGGGTGVTGSSDQFNFVSQSVTGSTSLVADLTTQSSTNTVAMAGVMLRDTTSTTSDYAAALVTPSNGIEFLWRTTTGATGSAIVTGKTAPLWVEITRAGNSFSAYYGSNGTSWTQIGSAQTITMGATYLAGMAVTSGDTVTANNAAFSSVGLYNITATAAAAPATVTGNTSVLTASASDLLTGSNVTYTWSSTTVPTGASAPTYSVNGTNAAASTTVAFTKAGNYVLSVAMQGSTGMIFSSSSVNLTVAQTPTAVIVSPPTSSLTDGQTAQFAAVVNDQFGNYISGAPAWSLESGSSGSISSSGLYAAPASGPGMATVSATYLGISGTATVSTMLSVIDGTSGNDTIRLVTSGSSLDVYINNAQAYTVPLASLGALSINGISGSDSITLDFSGGSPVPAAGITVNGGTGTTALFIVGTTGSDTFDLTGSSQFTVNGSLVAYQNVLAISFTGNSGNDTLNQLAQPGASVVFAGGAGDTLNVSAGVFFIPQSASGISTYSLAALNIGPGAAVAVNSDVSHADRVALELGSLSIAGITNAWTGRLDLGDNDLILHNGNLSQITNQVSQGFGLGSWEGDGITSSSAAASTIALNAIGIELNNDGDGNVLYGSGAALGTFDGLSPALTDILLKFTYYGDADLSGAVDGSDYSRIDDAFLNHLTGWSNGDFNYDGVVDGSDYTLIDNSFNAQGASLAAQVAARVAAPPTYQAAVIPPAQAADPSDSSDQKKKAHAQRVYQLDSL